MSVHRGGEPGISRANCPHAPKRHDTPVVPGTDPQRAGKLNHTKRKTAPIPPAAAGTPLPSPARSPAGQETRRQPGSAHGKRCAAAREEAPGQQSFLQLHRPTASHQKMPSKSIWPSSARKGQREHPQGETQAPIRFICIRKFFSAGKTSKAQL